jgi:hypothetical protein
MWSKDAQEKLNGDADSSEEESSEEDSEEDSDDAGPSQAEAAATRDARKQQKKARKEAAIAKAKAKTVEVGDMPSSDEDSEDEDDDDDDMPANPNHSKAARKQAAKPIEEEVDDLAEGVGKIQAGNRKEREALEAAAAKERYMKLQAQGKTDDAKADLARLKLIREQREAEAARRQVSYTSLSTHIHEIKQSLTKLRLRRKRRKSRIGCEKPRLRLARPRSVMRLLAPKRARRRTEQYGCSHHARAMAALSVRVFA